MKVNLHYRSKFVHWVICCLSGFAKNFYFYNICDFHVDDGWKRISLGLAVLWSGMKQCYLTLWTFSGLSASVIARQNLDWLHITVFVIKKRYTSRKSTVLFDCRRLQNLPCFYFCLRACVCVRMCVRVCGVSKAWQPTLYLLFTVTTELYNWGHQNYTYHRQFKLRNSIKLWNMVTMSVFLHYSCSTVSSHLTQSGKYCRTRIN